MAPQLFLSALSFFPFDLRLRTTWLENALVHAKMVNFFNYIWFCFSMPLLGIACAELRIG